MSGYDKNLLKDAPELTREERQEGYDPALAAPAPERISSPPLPSTTPHPPASAPSFPIADAGEAAALTGSGGAGKEYSSLSQDEEAHPGRTTPAPVSFWRTTRGKLLLALLALLIVGAIVGGAVGGTVGHNKSSNNSSGGGTSSVSPATSASQGVGSAGSGSGTSNLGGATASATTTPTPTSTNSGGVGGDGPSSSTTSSASFGVGTSGVGTSHGVAKGVQVGQQGVAFGVAERRRNQPRAAGAGAWAPDV